MVVIKNSNMTNRRLILCLLAFCVGVFTVALITLELFYVSSDEESSFQFSSHPNEPENGAYVVDGW